MLARIRKALNAEQIFFRSPDELESTIGGHHIRGGRRIFNGNG
jgi:hypothetical protein